MEGLVLVRSGWPFFKIRAQSGCEACGISRTSSSPISDAGKRENEQDELSCCT